MKVDFLIVGLGLAGSLLIHELRQKKKSFLVLDNPNQQKASSVAAGLVNPVVFRRLTKSWLIDELFPQLEKTYSELEAYYGVKLFYPIPIKKILGEGEADFWNKKYTTNRLQNYLSISSKTETIDFVETDFGIGSVNKSGRVDLKLLIETIKNDLREKQLLRFEEMVYNDLLLGENQLSYHDIAAKKVIFCEGHAASQNPFFKTINFRHTKGEVLRINTANYNSNFILNKSMFLMPEGGRRFYLGATYDWDNLNHETTPLARQELEDKLQKVFRDRYTIIGQQAGIRPTTHDRRPVVGFHPVYQQIGIFNGLGSKGTMLGPYFAKQLADFLCDKDNTLHPEVSVMRYFRNQ